MHRLVSSVALLRTAVPRAGVPSLLRHVASAADKAPRAAVEHNDGPKPSPRLVKFMADPIAYVSSSIACKMSSNNAT